MSAMESFYQSPFHLINNLKGHPQIYVSAFFKPFNVFFVYGNQTASFLKPNRSTRTGWALQ